MRIKAMIALSMGENRWLVSHVWHDGDITLHHKLTEGYPRREDAAHLMSLGNLLLVGKRIDECVMMVPHVHEEAKLITGEELENELGSDEHHVHMFMYGQWFHWMDEEAFAGSV